MRWKGQNHMKKPRTPKAKLFLQQQPGFIHYAGTTEQGWNIICLRENQDLFSDFAQLFLLQYNAAVYQLWDQ